MPQPLVSVIVPTKNSAEFLENCLKSIKTQSYSNIELVVVDNSSTDSTLDIARRYASLSFTRGPERSAQRNYGVAQSKGEYVVFIDSDMELEREVIEQCMSLATSKLAPSAIVIREESFGVGFWAQCKRLERSFYVGVPWMEAARFFRKDMVEKVGGYNESLVSGEDWDLSQRIEAVAPLARTYVAIRHNEGRLSLVKTLRKKYYYARQFKAYMRANNNKRNLSKQTSVFARYWLYFSRPLKLFKNPILGVGMLFMKTCEFGAGAIGMLR